MSSLALRAAVLFTLVTGSIGCKTVEIWDQGYPKTAEELPAQEAKQQEFNRFAIYEGGAGTGGGAVQLQQDKETDQYYALGSFSPVMTKVSPETKPIFNELRESNKYYYFALGLVIGSIFIDGEDKGAQIASNVAFGLGLGGIVGLSLWQNHLFNEAKDTYHRDLNRRIFAGDSASRGSQREIGLLLTWEINGGY